MNALSSVWTKLSVSLRLPGLRMLNNVRITRREVALASAGGTIPSCPDGLAVAEIPSVARLGAGDRVIAEIDQDGFIFAHEEEDKSLFLRRDLFLPRNRYTLQVVLYSGRICVKKTFRRSRPSPLGMKRRIQNFLGESFYGEAAALLRLRGVYGVPVLRGLDRPARTIHMDFIRGETLRERLGAMGHPIFDNDISAHPKLSCLSENELDRYEMDLLERERIVTDDMRRKLKSLVQEINRKGVAVLDVKPGNILVGGKTGALYIIDYEQAQLNSFSGYPAKLDEQFRSFNDWFGLDFSIGRRRDAP